MSMDILQGKDALSLLEEKPLQRAWDILYEQCPWSTGFQSRFFVSTWYDIYEKEYQPILLTQHSSTGELIGLLPLAIRNTSKQIVAAGDWQAEYQGWLTDPDECGAFIINALQLLRQQFPNKYLFFKFLPPLMPIECFNSFKNSDLPFLLQSHQRPIMELKDGSSVAGSLRKKSNKSRINRLKKLGELSFERITERSEFTSLFDEIIGYYDLRQGAKSNVLPFKDDPLKKAFHLALLKKPDHLHVTVFKVGGRVVASHLGVCGKKTVHLGIITHSPFHVKHSPGKLHILLLGKLLSEENYEILDLTPEGSYKDRFANNHDDVFSLTVYPNAYRLYQTAVNRRVQALGSATLKKLNLNPVLIKSMLFSFLHTKKQVFFRDLISKIRLWLWESIEYRIYLLKAEPEFEFDNAGQMVKDCISELLKFPKSWPLERRKTFLQKSFQRLEMGQHVYTLSEGDTLNISSWFKMNQKNKSAKEADFELCNSSNAVWIFDIEVFSDIAVTKLHHLSFNQMIHDATKLPEIDKIFVSVPTNNPSLCQDVETLGFSYVTSHFKQIRFGKIRLWAKLNSLELGGN